MYGRSCANAWSPACPIGFVSHDGTAGAASTTLGSSGCASVDSVFSTTKSRSSLAPRYEVTMYMRYLLSFRSTLEHKLGLVEQLLRSTDAEIAEAVAMKLPIVRALTNDAADVMNMLCASSVSMCCGLADALALAIERDLPNIVSSILSETQQQLVAMHTAAKNLRTRYVHLMDAIQYLVRCVEVSLDHTYMLRAEHDYKSEILGQLLEMALLSSLNHLKNAHETLDNIPDFWLMLHTFEKGLEQHVANLQNLHKILMGGGDFIDWGGDLRDLLPRCLMFCDSLQQLFQVYAVSGMRVLSAPNEHVSQHGIPSTTTGSQSCRSDFSRSPNRMTLALAAE